MTVKEIVDAITKQGMPQPGVAQVPTPELLALFVRLHRGLRQWKQKTLADFANVSLSTVERVERAEKVSNENLDCIAVALGCEPGCFASPRLPLSWDEGVRKLAETWGNLEPVPVRRLCNQTAVRKVANCHAFLLYLPGIDEAHKSSVSELGEWLRAASWMTGHPSTAARTEGHKRQIYERILACIGRLESSGLYVLGGVMNAPQPGIPERQVGIVAITSKKTDPGALKRRHILVDRRCAETQVYCPDEGGATLARNFAESLLRSSVILDEVVHGRNL